MTKFGKHVVQWVRFPPGEGIAAISVRTSSVEFDLLKPLVHLGLGVSPSDGNTVCQGDVRSRPEPLRHCRRRELAVSVWVDSSHHQCSMPLEQLYSMRTP